MYPARKLKVVVAPTIPRGITTKGNKSPNSKPIILDSPALITIKGIAAKKIKNNLDLEDKPPFCQPNKSSTIPTIELISKTARIAKRYPFISPPSPK